MNLPNLPDNFFCAALAISAAKSFFTTAAHKGLNTAFLPLGGVRMPPAPQEGHTSPHRGWHRSLCFWAVVPDAGRQSLAENSPAKIRRLISDFLNLLGVPGLRRRISHDYGVVDFSVLFPVGSNFSEDFHLLESLLFVMVRLVDLFPPKNPEGSPPTSRWVRKALSGFFHTN